VRFLADESCCDGSLVQALRTAGHDVRLAAVDMRGEDDDVVAEAALADRRVLITKDRDFGQLVFAIFVVVRPTRIRVRRRPTT
jgi:predicted nuclease of predicted toxin-antitoxin system